MKVAVVTPVYQTPRAWLDECLASVARQSHPCTHFVVCDGDQLLNRQMFPGVEFLDLPRPHRDIGNAARAIGSVSAIAQGYDAIAYLDSDNWYAADHIEQMVRLHQQKNAAVCTAGRNLIDLEGQLMGRCPEVDGEKFADTNCMFLTRSAFGIVSVWYRMPGATIAMGDRVVWQAICEQKLKRAHCAEPTVCYRTNFRKHYAFFGRTPPPNCKELHISVTSAGNVISSQIIDVGTAESSSPKKQQAAPKARVSLCMIVKNEEAHLDECLAPLAGLFHEIVVVDTGSTDRTKEIARRHGAKVHDFVWVDSFAAARNESIKHASGDWLLWLDADDRLDTENLARLRLLLQKLPNENNAYMMCQWSTPDPMNGSPLLVDQVRLFRKLPSARWRYRVHEQIYLALSDAGAREVGTDIVIRHLGYQDTTLRRRKQDRNIRLLQIELAETPRDAFVLFNLANARMDRGQPDEAIPLLHRCIENAPAGVSYLPRAYCLLTTANHLLGRNDEALRHCREGKAHCPETPDLWFQEGVLLIAHGSWPEARTCFETVLRLRPKRHYIGVDAEMTGFRTRHNLAIVYRHLKLPDKAEEQLQAIIAQSPQFGPAWVALAELYIEQKRMADASGLPNRLKGEANCESILSALEARLALASGDVSGACATLEEGLVRAPKIIWLRLFLADMLLRVAKNEAAAQSHYRIVLDLAPNDAQARLRLAEIQAARKG